MSKLVRALPWHTLFWIMMPAVTGLLLLLLRWKHFGEVRVDFGQEMTVPWLITEGKHLYVDIAYFKGPFSPHWNALLMMLFGVSVQTIVVSNAITATLIAYGMLALGKRACGLPVSSFLACSFLIVFGYSFDRVYNNFNFISPFVHELPHGIAFSVITFLALERWRHTQSGLAAATAGLGFGLTWLTRIEVSVALSAACIAWIACAAFQGTARAALVRGIAQAVSAAFAVILTCVLALGSIMPWKAALRSTFASLDAVLHTNVIHSPFFSNVGGWNHPWAGLGFQLVVVVIMLFWLLSFYAAADFLRRRDWLFGGAFASGGIMTVALLHASRLPPFLYGTGLSLITIGILSCALVCMRRQHGADSFGMRMMVVLGIFSLAMLLKIFFVPSIRFYGFAHAMPAYMLFLAVMLTALPVLVRRQLGSDGARILLVLLIATVVCDVRGKGLFDQYLTREKTLPVGTGPDRIYVSNIPENLHYRDFLLKAPSLIPPRSTLTVIPEGVMVNYLLRLPLGVPTINFMRTEYFIFGKDRIEGQLYERRPDFILLTHKETSEFGLPLYGKMPEYGADVMAWLTREYAQIALFGEQPLTHPESEGVALWRRKDFRLPQNPQDVPSPR